LVTILRNSILLIGVMVFAFLLLQDNEELIGEVLKVARSELSASRGRASQPSPTEEEDVSSDGSVMVIEADSRGHYYLTAEIGGRDINFLVDTGATLVALTLDDAQTIGFPVYQLEYSGRSNTANGQIRVAPLVIDEIIIDGNSISNVRGSVSEAPLHISLLGMSFLRKLAGFEVKNDRLILRW